MKHDSHKPVSIIQVTPENHHDSGWLINYGDQKSLTNAAKAELLSNQMGGPYHISLPVKDILEFIQNTPELNKDQIQAFCNGLVDLSVGVAGDITTGHNKFVLSNEFIDSRSFFGFSPDDHVKYQHLITLLQKRVDHHLNTVKGVVTKEGGTIHFLGF